MNETYCHFEKRCVNEGDSPCGNNKDLAAFLARDVNNSVFIMEPQRFSPMGLVHSKWAAFTVPMVDYEVVFTRKFNAYGTGMVIFHVDIAIINFCNR